VYYKSGTVVCLDLSGNEKWQVNLDETYGAMDLWWDMGNSPVLAGDRVIIARMHAGDSYLVALDLNSGNVIWKQPRQYRVPTECDQAYTTPHIVTIDGRKLVVTWGADHLTGHDVATGEMVFESGGFNPDNQGMWRVIASAAVGQGVAIVPHGRGNLLAAVALDGQGVVTESHRLWTKEIDGPDVPTPLVTGDRVLVLGDAGNLTCLDIRSGQVVWTAKIPGNRRTKFYASPVLAGDTLFCAREDGKIYVGQVRDEGFTQLAENEMGETLIATPVPIRGGLLIRGAEHLFFVESRVAASGG
jgi:outer membrane protein assembly factor BamB